MELLNYSLAVSVFIASISFLIFTITYTCEPWLDAFKEQARANRSKWRKDIETRLKNLEDEH